MVMVSNRNLLQSEAKEDSRGLPATCHGLMETLTALAVVRGAFVEGKHRLLDPHEQALLFTLRPKREVCIAVVGLWLWLFCPKSFPLGPYTDRTQNSLAREEIAFTHTTYN